MTGAEARSNGFVDITRNPAHTRLMQVSERFGPEYEAIDVGEVMQVTPAEPLRLDCGVEWSSFPLAYQQYGEMNAAKDNVVLVCHGLTGDQYAASPHPVTGKPGWWEFMIGPGKAIDTDRFCVIATNVIGSCMGSYGPKSLCADTGLPWGLDFPVITIHDMVRAQAALMDALGVAKLAAVIGGSMGGMQVLSWATQFPERVRAAIPLATGARHSAQNIAFHEIGRQAIMADPEWRGGQYVQAGTYPAKGLAVARMTAHVTYLSEQALAEKFGRGLQDKKAIGYGFDADFQVESYLRYQGANFVKRFDPNAYLYITRAMDYFDLASGYGGNLAKAFKRSTAKFCVVSFSSDWCFPTSASRDIVKALTIAGAAVSFVEIESDKGHDAFLLDIDALKEVVGGFLGSLDV